ncbi:nitroreductase family protein [Alteromonas mediterranea]|uniref:nitroreductase family protein n=1 Tax=Alteromonas mediterranea TaxID=314275 RepID=UPI0009033882|nr:nitroreductase family protein [Alteromonas mediterranea]APD94886.1 nitroreductase family protein [Alteromonas mediterranea]APD98521.1 nitroreductase family protein [Alteromonas mediterranea]
MQPHDHSPLNDFIEYSEQSMLARSAEFLKAMQRRHSIRHFNDRPVDKAIIENCILTAGTAPSGANHQPWHFSAIHSAPVKKQIREQAEAHERGFYDGRAGQQWLDDLKPLGTDASKPYLETAPWLIAVFSQKFGETEAGDRSQNYYVHESVGIAVGMLITSLHNAGLATLTHTPKPMNFLTEVCQRPDNERAYMLIVAGYPAHDATVPNHAKQKKSLNEIASFL